MRDSQRGSLGQRAQLEDFSDVQAHVSRSAQLQEMDPQGRFNMNLRLERRVSHPNSVWFMCSNARSFAMWKRLSALDRARNLLNNLGLQFLPCNPAIGNVDRFPTGPQTASGISRRG